MKVLIFLLLTYSTMIFGATAPKDAFSQVQEGKAVIIDVREENEIKSGMIQKSLWFPLSKMQDDPRWEKDLKKMAGQKTIYLYCRSGNRSGKAQEILKNKKIESENIGGFETLKDILPVTKP